MVKKVNLLLLVLLICLTANAGEVTEQEALLKAQRFMQGKQFMQGKKLTQSQTQVCRAPQKNVVAYYVFNVENEDGFVIVSGDDRTSEILGYSDCGTLNPDKAPDNVKWWLSEYERQMEWLFNSTDESTIRRATETSHRDGWTAIEPLVKSQWNQGTPYNSLCPTINSQATYTGCVATAMAQIMNYHQWPLTGRGSNNYEWNGQPLSMDFSEITFDWENMQNTYSYNGQDDSPESRNAVATLMSACGISVYMKYGIDESVAASFFVESALRHNFDYDANYIFRDGYELSDWEDLIYKEITYKRPVYYAGASSTGGHAFICDGYSNDGLFHINWGWGGWYDGYFLLNVLDPYGNEDGYRDSQQIIYGIRPVQKVVIDGVYYSILEEEKEAFVCPPDEGYYTGDLTIPLTVTFGGETYTVVIKDNTIWSYCQNLTSLIVYPQIYRFGDYWNSRNSPNLETIKLYNISHISNWAFQDCKSLTTLELGESLESIGYGTFYNCNALTELIMPDKITSIDDYAFYGCNSLTTLELGSSLESIGERAFYNCNALTELIMQDKITSIGDYAFYGCNSLATLKLSSSLETIGRSVFNGCNALTELTIPDKVTSIGDYAFYWCPTLTTLKLGAELETIGKLAFYYCAALTELAIPDKVVSIGDDAFSYCYNLEKIIIPNSVENIGKDAFAYCYKNRTIISYIEDPFDLLESPFSESAYAQDMLYVPYGTVEKYQAKEVWKNFENIIEIPNMQTVSVGEDGLATYCSTFAVDFSNAIGIVAYKASVSDNCVTLTKVETVAAGEGVLLRSLNGGAVEEELPIIENATANGDNAFVGVLEATTLNETDGEVTNFVLSKKNDVVGFYKANNTPIAAGKAYLPVVNYSAAGMSLGMTFGDTTGIREIEIKQPAADDATYTLGGVRVKNPTKGIYIKNGRKVVVK